MSERELGSRSTEAVGRFQRDRLGELLARLERESGPIPEDLVGEARRLWEPAAAPGVAESFAPGH